MMNFKKGENIIGVIVLGSMPPHSKSIFEEGAVFMSFKLVEKGVFQEQGIWLAHIISMFNFNVISIVFDLYWYWNNNNCRIDILLFIDFDICCFLDDLIMKWFQFDLFSLIALIDALMAPSEFPGSSGTRNLKDNISDLRAQVAANQKVW